MRDFSKNYPDRDYRPVWAVNDESRVACVQAFSCGDDGDPSDYVWVPEMGVSMPKNHTFKTEKAAVEHAILGLSVQIRDLETKRAVLFGRLKDL